MEVLVGRHRFQPVQRFLDVHEAGNVLHAYRARNPRLLRLISWLLGWTYDGSDEALDRIAASWPMVAFSPATAAGRAPES